MKLRFVFILLFGLTFVSGCSTVNKTFDSIGGLFNKKGDKCSGPECENPSLIDNQRTTKKWHCYGQQGTEEWECQTEADNTKISSIQPEARTPRQAVLQQVETLQQQQQNSSASLDVPAPNPRQAEAETQESAPSKQNDSLLDQPADYYTIQLIALPQQSEVMKYAETNGITTPLTALINSQGTPWHVLLLGIYPDKSSAETAASDWIATKNLKIQPWIRPLGPLQDAIRGALKG